MSSAKKVPPYVYRHNELDDSWFADKEGMTVARMDVDRQGAQDRYHYPDGTITHGGTVPLVGAPGYGPKTRKVDPPTADSREDFNYYSREHAAGHGGQLPLFLQQHVAPREVVTDLYAGEAHRVAAMTMVGAALNFNQQQYGRQLQPSMSLSPHSAKLVSHLQEAGIVDPARHVDVMNDTGFDSEQVQPTPASFWKQQSDRTLDEGEIRRGRTTIRSIIGRRRAETPSQQGTLF
jgi:hypothetical protein